MAVFRFDLLLSSSLLLDVAVHCFQVVSQMVEVEFQPSGDGAPRDVGMQRILQEAMVFRQKASEVSEDLLENLLFFEKVFDLAIFCHRLADGLHGVEGEVEVDLLDLFDLLARLGIRGSLHASSHHFHGEDALT